MGFLFFVLFALTLVGMYVVLRRHLAPPGLIAGLGMFTSALTMTLYLLTQVDVMEQGIIFGILIGVFFAGATMFTAWYFNHQEQSSVE
jgi:drug/metabolite transporter (DMT)-like permease